MAKIPQSGDVKAESPEPTPICGVIMPISPTESHDADHWRDVQVLIHRGIQAAGFRPHNVWENTSTDRVSERIIGNIFNVPIAVADISDLNPNVMLELGLRLASKKPTIVIMNDGGIIPFDIRDFHAIFYPSDLNILRMEDFFSKIAKALKEKHSALVKGDYNPFLNSVIVDVASPQTREVGVNELLLSRLEELSMRLARMEAYDRRPRPSARTPRASLSLKGNIDIIIPVEKFDDFKSEVMSWYEVDMVRKKTEDQINVSGVVVYSGADSVVDLHSRLSETIGNYGGEIDVPF